MTPEMTPLQWHRNRRWLDGEIERLEQAIAAHDDDLARGMQYGLLKVKAFMFLTDDERSEAEQTRREMFG